ncbi:MAG TPA: fluoride efflux transporter CrcB [Solirubrobacteraceae bacterium]|jgi:CrcB protein|nr:fluoride efflux transporter CrcB [Solirubrobacteraceae bacterium]
MSAPVWIGVALLGGGGAIARFALDTAIGARAAQASSLPLGTLAVNASGALLLGVLSGAGAGGDALLLAGTAALGSYTTFSTWMLESQRLAEEAQGRGAALNILLSLATGVAAAALGHAIGAGP